MRKFIRPICAAAWVAGLGSPAAADEVTVTVSYADLDLASLEDVAALHERLAEALRQACRTKFAHGLTAKHADDQCVESGLANGERVITEHRDRVLAAAP